MNAKKVFIIALAFLLTGCLRAAELAQVRRNLERNNPDLNFEKEIEITLGPLSLGFFRVVSLFVPDTRAARAVMKEIDRVKLAVYRVKSPSSAASLHLPAQVQNMLGGAGWEVLIKARDDHEVLWLLYRMRGESLRDFYLIVLDNSELVLVRLEGRLERLIVAAIEQRDRIISGQFDDWDDWGEHFARSDARHALLPDFWNVEHDGVVFRHNRVDGLFLGWRLLPYRKQFPSYYGEIGYALSGGHGRFQVGLENTFSLSRSTVGVEFHHLTATEDDWVISSDENTIYSLLLKRDFRDYYRRSGGSIYLMPEIDPLEFSLRVMVDDFDSLKNQANWSLFSSGPANSRFRPNPIADEGGYHSIRADLDWDGRDSRSHPGRGWHATAHYEYGGGIMGGDYDFQRGLADVRRYQPLASGMRLDLRLRAGAGSDLPVQYHFDVGGYSTLRGYRFKKFSGDRLVLFNVELWTNTDRLAKRPGIPENLNVGVFLDTGAAWFENPAPPSQAGIPIRSEAKFKTSAGWALDLRDLRLYVARPLNADDWRVSARISRTF